jgi:hypothetical protein
LMMLDGCAWISPGCITSEPEIEPGNDPACIEDRPLVPAVEANPVDEPAFEDKPVDETAFEDKPVDETAFERSRTSPLTKQRSTVRSAR